MEPSDFRLVYITCESLGAAQAMGRARVAERLAACVNLVPGIQSIYRWEGRICESEECILLAKTRAERLPALKARVAELHSYECPCLVSFALSDGAASFLEWLAAETDPASSPG